MFEPRIKDSFQERRSYVCELDLHVSPPPSVWRSALSGSRVVRKQASKHTRNSRCGGRRQACGTRFAADIFCLSSFLASNRCSVLIVPCSKSLCKSSSSLLPWMQLMPIPSISFFERRHTASSSFIPAEHDQWLTCSRSNVTALTQSICITKTLLALVSTPHLTKSEAVRSVQKLGSRLELERSKGWLPKLQLVGWVLPMDLQPGENLRQPVKALLSFGQEPKPGHWPAWDCRSQTLILLMTLPLMFLLSAQHHS